MAATNTLLKIGLAQIDGRLGDVERNAERHLDWIARAREAGVDLLVFPELSLTGYRLLHLTPRVALPLDSPVLTRLAEAAGPMRVVVGFVEEGERGVLHNSAVLLAGGAAVHVHRKLYLPTYGIFQEERFFGAGRRLETFPLPWGTAGLLICEDLWHPELARRLAVAGTKLLIVVSAAPDGSAPGALPESQESWETPHPRHGAAQHLLGRLLQPRRLGGRIVLSRRQPRRAPRRRDRRARAAARRAPAGGRDRPARLRPPALAPAAARRRAHRYRGPGGGSGGVIRREQVRERLRLNAPLAEAVLTSFIRDAVETAGTAGVVGRALRRRRLLALGGARRARPGP